MERRDSAGGPYSTSIAKMPRVQGAIGKEEDAKAMLAEGISVALIAKITGLNKDDIEGLMPLISRSHFG